MTQPVSFGRRISDLARERPDKIALVFSPRDGADRSFSWADIERRSLQIAALLQERGAGQGSTVIVGLPNSPEHVFAAIASWKLGACVLPLRFDLPAWERERLLEIAKPSVTIGDWSDSASSGSRVSLSELDATRDDDAPALADRVANPACAIASSGSTGRPKIIVRPGGGQRLPGSTAGPVDRNTGDDGNTELVPAPLYHTNGFYLTHFSLLDGDRVVLMERFDAAKLVDLIERYRVNIVTMVPTMLLRVARLPGVRERDFSSITAVLQGGASCPNWLVRFWIDLIGGQRLIMSYGSTEGVGMVSLNGADWLEHPGSVGISDATEVRILDDDGADLPAGKVGEIYLRRVDEPEPAFEYIGAPPAKRTEDGFTSIGDLGWLDDDGYLYIADRRADMIVSGGANVFPAEVEAALLEHPEVFDVAVVGLPDPEWGQRIHAIVQPTDAEHAPSAESLRAHCRERLAGYKVPKEFECVAELPRSDAGKLNRSALAEARREDRSGHEAPRQQDPACDPSAS
jgi:bile acid-coenzyme A ligase